MSAVCFAAVLAVVWGYLAVSTLVAWRFSRQAAELEPSYALTSVNKSSIYSNR